MWSSFLGTTIIFAIATFLLSISCVSARLVIENPSPQDHLPLADCTLHLMQRFISVKTKVLLVMENCYACPPAQDDFNLRLLDHILQNSATITSFQLYVAATDEQPWNYNIFIVNDVIAFNQLSFFFPESLGERDFYFLIILTDKGFYSAEAAFRNATMHRIFATCVQFNVLNAVILFEARDSNNKSTLLFYSYHRYDLQNCQRRLSVVEVNRYEAGSRVFAEDYLFPPRLRNFHKCALHVSAHLLPPALSFRGDVANPDHVNDVSRLTGIEGYLLRVLSQALNFTIRLRLHQDNNMFSSKFNWTSYYSELNTDGADLAIGALSGSDTHRFMFSASISYHQSPFVLVVRSELRQGQLKQLVQSFSLTVWLTIVLCFVVALRVIKALQDYAPPAWRAFVFGARNNSPRTNLFAVFLGNPVSRLPHRNFARFIFTAWMLGASILRDAYQAKFFGNLRAVQRAHVPRDISELLASNYSLLTAMFHDFYPRNRSIVVKSTNYTQLFEMLEQQQQEGLVSPALLDMLDHYRQRHRDTKLTQITKPIHLYHQVIYFRRHSALKSSFDHRLLQLMGAGLTSQIAKRHLKGERAGSKHRAATAISNMSLRGTYYIYLMLIGVAVLCFGLEVLTQRNWLRWRRLRDCLEAAHSIEL